MDAVRGHSGGQGNLEREPHLRNQGDRSATPATRVKRSLGTDIVRRSTKDLLSMIMSVREMRKKEECLPSSSFSGFFLIASAGLAVLGRE